MYRLFTALGEIKMKFVIVYHNQKFKVMFDNGEELVQARQYGKDCIFNHIKLAHYCCKALNGQYTNH